MKRRAKKKVFQFAAAARHLIASKLQETGKVFLEGGEFFESLGSQAKLNLLESHNDLAMEIMTNGTFGSIVWTVVKRGIFQLTLGYFDKRLFFEVMISQIRYSSKESGLYLFNYLSVYRANINLSPFSPTVVSSLDFSNCEIA